MRKIIILIILLLFPTPCFAMTQNELDQINAEIGTLAIKTEERPIDAKGWNQNDTALLILEIIDWGQTRYISKYGIEKKTIVEPGDIINPEPEVYTLTEEKYHEINPILGPHPSLGKVNTYFLICIGTDILVAQYANPKIHKWWQTIGIILETYCVANNWRIGVKIDF